MHSRSGSGGTRQQPQLTILEVRDFMANYPSQPMIEAARRDPSARSHLLSLCNYYDQIVAKVASSLVAALPVEPAKQYELGRDAMLLAENQWVDLSRHIKKQPGGKQLLKTACHKGCSWCCYLHVEISSVEALTIAHHLQQTCTAEELASLTDKVQATADRLAILGAKDRIPHKIPCTMLNTDGSCRIYAFRPLSCRGWNSVDDSTCSKAFGILDQTTPIQFWQAACFDGVLQGLLQGLKTGGLDGELVELNAGLAAALAQFKSAQEEANYEAV